MIKQVYLNFPNESAYKSYLLTLRWENNIICPYCSSIKNSELHKKHIFHCNSCNSNFTITIHTVMHNSKIELRKWLIALYLFLNNESMSYRKLSSIINVNKKTAHRIISEFHSLFTKNRLLILKIAGMNRDEVEIMSRMLLINIRRRT